MSRRAGTILVVRPRCCSRLGRRQALEGAGRLERGPSRLAHHASRCFLLLPANRPPGHEATTLMSFLPVVCGGWAYVWGLEIHRSSGRTRGDRQCRAKAATSKATSHAFLGLLLPRALSHSSFPPTTPHTHRGTMMKGGSGVDSPSSASSFVPTGFLESLQSQQSSSRFNLLLLEHGEVYFGTSTSTSYALPPSFPSSLTERGPSGVCDHGGGLLQGA